jgi:membrane protease YdiL (CAAX protease family)
MVPLLLLSVASLALIITGVLRRPGTGIIVALLIISYSVFYRNLTWAQMGFRPQQNWAATITFALILGSAIALLATGLIDPAAEHMTGEPHDISIVDGIRADAGVLIRWLIMVWLFVALLEELVFRGYLMSELFTLLPAGIWGQAANLIITSIIFGLAHAYQGPSGTLSATLIGLLIGIIFLGSGLNLWLVILIHGFIDTIQLFLLFAGRYDMIKHAIIKPGN